MSNSLCGVLYRLVNYLMFLSRLLNFLQAFGHILEDVVADRENPRGYHCYIDEDAVLQWKRLAIAAPAPALEERTMTRYLVRLGATAK